MTIPSRAQRNLEHKLCQAIQEEQFTLFYQPQFDLVSKTIIGVEALLRWRDDELGQIAPSTFISLAETTGMINELGSWVLHTACKQNKAWQNAGYMKVKMSVNISGRQFDDDNFAHQITHALEESGLAAEYLELELTESLYMSDIHNTIELLTAIRQLGVTIAVDDFGTGHSSLAYLAILPLDTLKIDRAFIQHITSNSKGIIVLGTIINMAQELNLRIIAEGIETKQQLSYLNILGCDAGQGFLLGKPLPCDKITAYLRNNKQPCHEQRGTKTELMYALAHANSLCCK